MTPRRRLLIAGAVLAAIVVAAAVIAFLRISARPTMIAPAQVPSAWAAFRSSEGHAAHLRSGKITCKDCHEHERAGFDHPGTAPCARCHAAEASHGHGGEIGKAAAGAACLGCHAFAPDQPKTTCLGCHATAQGPLAAVKQHQSVTCEACHRPHQDPAIVPQSCANCHAEANVHDAAKKGGSGCSDCHQGHAPASAAVATCSGCHATPAGPKPAGHAACSTCHVPHEPAAKALSACANCHAGKTTLAADHAPAHAVCTSCHAPHAPEGAAASCKGCHADVHVGRHRSESCVSCHAPHGGNGTTSAIAHGAGGAIAKSCTSCHAAVATSDRGVHAAGMECAQCHRPHDFASPERPAGCAGCHAGEVQRASTNRGHADCTTCHGASTHRPTAAPSCSTCHKQEGATAPKGHDRCVGCHEPHSGARDAHAACNSCHAREAATPHATVAGGCASCHRPHGPKGISAPPGCVSCHARPTLPALHAAAGHAECKSCHAAHGPPRSDRATCTTGCHQDRRTHQPDATACKGCHVFRR